MKIGLTGVRLFPLALLRSNIKFPAPTAVAYDQFEAVLFCCGAVVPIDYEDETTLHFIGVITDDLRLSSPHKPFPQ